MTRIVAKLRGESGAALVEYVILAALIGVASLVAMEKVEEKVDQAFHLASEAAAPLGEYTGDGGGGDSGDTGDTGDTGDGGGGDSGDTGDTGDSSDDTGDTGDSSDDTGDTGDSSDDTGDTGDSSDDTGDTGDSSDDTPAPPQYVTADTRGGYVTFVADDGEISIDGYDLKDRWTGKEKQEDDGSIVVTLRKKNSDKRVRITAWLDEDGNLQVSIENYTVDD